MMHALLERPPYEPGPVPGFSLVKATVARVEGYENQHPLFSW